MDGDGDVVDVELRKAREQRGDVCVRAQPSITTSNMPVPWARSSSPYAAAPASADSADSVEGIGCTSAGSTPTWSRNDSRA